MAFEIRVGDRVKLLSLPDWLIHDLPEREKMEMRACIGQTSMVSEIDAYGYFWLGFGTTIKVGDSSYYSGHSFCVPKECIALD